MPAQAGIQVLKLGPRLRGGDKLQTLSFRINKKSKGDHGIRLHMTGSAMLQFAWLDPVGCDEWLPRLFQDLL